MQHSLESCLDKIIHERRLIVLFQPLVQNARRTIYGYEALIRGPSDSPLHSPLTLFETAARHGRLVDLERLCREASIEQFRRLNLAGKLFLNASPESLFQPGYRSGRTLDKLKRVGLAPERVVIELTEQYPMENYEAVREAKNHYKKMGFEIAIDDLGAGYAGLRMWSELQPDYVKIDRHFMNDIHHDQVKQEFVRSILNIARGLNCRVVAEGVETAEEYQTVSKMGIEFTQGYYFERPSQTPSVHLPRALFHTLPEGVNRHGGRSYLSKSVGELLQQVPGIPATTTVEEAALVFQRAPLLESLPVLAGNRPLGLVRRNNLMNMFLSRFGRELHGRKPVERFLDHHTLMLEKHLPIEEASSRVSEQMQQNKALEFLITSNGEYLGVGSVIDLLKMITELQVRNARYANPLTMLPGNVPLYEELDRLLQEQADFVVCYCDLDNFKPFNDKYGYEKGDQVIKLVAEVIAREVDETRDFVGHIGGDDFILILRSEDWQLRCRRILDGFGKAVHRFYASGDVEQGGIWSEDRSGNRRFFPLLSLSIGSVQPDPASCKSHHDVATLASAAKHEAKKRPGNVLFVDRRRRPFAPQQGRTGQAASGASLQGEGVADRTGLEPARDADSVPLGG